MTRTVRMAGAGFAALIAASTLLGAPLAVQPALAVTTSAFVLDALSAGSGHIVRAFHDPADATIEASWDGGHFNLNVQIPGSGLSFGLGLAGVDPTVGTHPNSDINGCTGTLTINSVDPALHYGTPATVNSVSATFSRTNCNGESTNGELRFHTADAYAALGLTTSPASQAMFIATPLTFVGKRSPSASITLKNLGTTTLTFGTPTFQPSDGGKWSIGPNACTGTLAPAASCTLSATTLSWIPNEYGDFLRLPVSTTRGFVQIDASSRSSAATFVPIDPVRLVDTRIGLGISSALATGVSRTITVVNRTPGTPATNIPAAAVAVTGNLTLIKPTTSGSAALTTTATNSPTITTLRLPASQSRSNSVIVRLSSSGTLGLTWVGGSGSSANATFDVTGYFVPVSGIGGVREGNYRPWEPTRVVNTATGLGVSTKLAAGQARSFNIPLQGVEWDSTAALGVVTVVSPAQKGSVYIGPTAKSAPNISMMNFKPSETRSNAFIVKLGQPGSYPTPKQLTITYTGAAGTYINVTVDIYGLFRDGAGGGGYVPLLPTRVVDTANHVGLSSALASNTFKFANVANRYPADGSKNLPPDNNSTQVLFKSGVVANLWMMKPTSSGTLTAQYVGATTPPPISMFRTPATDRRAFTTIIKWVGDDLELWYTATAGATTNVLVDVSGYFIQP